MNHHMPLWLSIQEVFSQWILTIGANKVMRWFEYLPYILLCLFLMEPMAEAVRLTHKFDNVTFMREASDQCIRHFLVLECVIMPFSLIVLLVEAILGAV